METLFKLQSGDVWGYLKHRPLVLVRPWIRLQAVRSSNTVQGSRGTLDFGVGESGFRSGALRTESLPNLGRLILRVAENRGSVQLM